MTRRVWECRLKEILKRFFIILNPTKLSRFLYQVNWLGRTCLLQLESRLSGSEKWCSSTAIAAVFLLTPPLARMRKRWVKSTTVYIDCDTVCNNGGSIQLLLMYIDSLVMYTKCSSRFTPSWYSTSGIMVYLSHSSWLRNVPKLTWNRGWKLWMRGWLLKNLIGNRQLLLWIARKGRLMRLSEFLHVLL